MMRRRFLRSACLTLALLASIGCAQSEDTPRSPGNGAAGFTWTAGAPADTGGYMASTGGYVAATGGFPGSTGGTVAATGGASATGGYGYGGSMSTGGAT